MDLGRFGLDFSFCSDSRIHKTFACCGFLRFYHILISFAILSMSETTFGQVTGGLESHVRS